MIIYNLTMHVDHSIHYEWLQWQKEEHIPAIMATKQFTEYRFFHLLDQDETEGITYVTQFVAPSADHYKRFLEEFAPVLRSKTKDKWDNRLVVFRTVMEVIH
ncbi:MAG: hypothetical protein JWM28_1758 [Chitinophagaceae bacterium]|nr:hypothetical protein [Chitinophagaceae bacterium]